MSSCTPTPTSTQFTTHVTNSVSTSFSELVTTLQGSTSTTLITSCLASSTPSASGSQSGGAGGGGAGTCISSTVIESTTVIPGGQSTTQVPVPVTIPITTTEAVQTFFATCADGSTPNPPNHDTTTTTTSTTSTFTTLTTPTTTFTTSSQTTLPNGEVTETVLTVVSTLPPSSIVVTSSGVVTPSTQQGNSGGTSGSKANIGAIVGGVVGGIAGLGAFLLLLWFFCRRRANWDDIFEKDIDDYVHAQEVKHGRAGRGNLLDAEDEPIQPPANTEPRPYVYGLVGSQHAMSPPSMNAGLQDASSFNGSHSLSDAPLVAGGAMLGGPSSSRPTSSGEGYDASRRSGSGAGSPPLVDVGRPDSPHSPNQPRKLFVANHDPMSMMPPPDSPASTSGMMGMGMSEKRRSANNVPYQPSIASAMAGGPERPMSYPPNERQDLARTTSASSYSVYSQGSGSVQSSSRPPPGVVVHQDAGRIAAPANPPSYKDS